MRIWIDLDNAPHVPFFRPLIQEFEARGHSVSVTIRDYGYTAELADQARIIRHSVGSHPGGNVILKLVSLGWRALMLAAWARGRAFDVAISHGSRGLVAATWLSSIPSVTMYDYEHVSSGLFKRLSTLLLLPEALRNPALGHRVRYYSGYKEEVYLGDFEPTRDLLTGTPVPAGRVLVLIRPPATTAHYHDSRSEGIFKALLDRISTSDAFGIVVPRTAEQAAEIRKILENPLNFHILDHPVDGLDLIWQVDLVVGGGGTMNREAALLGVPVYSIFTGPVGTIDNRLSEEGRLHLIETVEDVTRIKLEPRKRGDIEDQLRYLRLRSRSLISEIVDRALEVAK